MRFEAAADSDAVPRQGCTVVEVAGVGPAVSAVPDGGQEPGLAEDQGQLDSDSRLRCHELHRARFKGESQRPDGLPQRSAASSARERRLQRAGQAAVGAFDRTR